MIIVVLGMHRSGTSLVANVLSQLGVHMGDRLMGPNTWNPHGHWEDLDFYELNVALLAAAEGDWAHPPTVEAIEEMGPWFRPEMRNLVDWKAGQGRAAWGWKDPRNCLTVGLWHPLLGADVRYVHVVREIADVVDSLRRRAVGVLPTVESWLAVGLASRADVAKDREMAEWDESAWRALVHDYEGRVASFLAQAEAPNITVAFENLVDPERVSAAVTRLAGFVGVEDASVIEGAVGCVVTR